MLRPTEAKDFWTGGSAQREKDEKICWEEIGFLIRCVWRKTEGEILKGWRTFYKTWYTGCIFKMCRNFTYEVV
jgi:hypothetical protein